MEVSGRANGVSFSETDDWKQDEVIKTETFLQAVGRAELRNL
jgi:hypothetical protein